MRTPEVRELLTRRDGLAVRLKAARGPKPAKDFAEEANWHPSKVSRLESGKQLPNDEDLQVWAGLTDTPEVVLDQWRAMLAEAESLRSSFDRRFRHGQAQYQDRINKLIEDATTLRFFEKEWIPRVLQVEAYTRAVLTHFQAKFGTAVDDVDEAVAVRQSSTEYLYRPGRTFELIICESVLYGAWPSPEIMRGQLDRLWLATTNLSSVRLGIYPIKRPGNAPPPPASFEMYGDTVLVEYATGESWVTDELEVAKYHREMDELWSHVLEGDAARRAIAEAQDELNRT